MRQTEWGSVCVCVLSESAWVSGWTSAAGQRGRGEGKEREREGAILGRGKERERGSVPSERTHSSGCDWSMGQLTRGALSSSCTLLFIPPLPHTAILSPTTHTHIDTLTYMHTMDTTLCWHFILSFSTVELCTKENYWGYTWPFSQVHCRA